MANNSTSARSALSPTPWAADAWRWPLTLVAIVGALVVFVVPQFVYVAIASAAGWIDLHDLHRVALSPRTEIVAQFASYVPFYVYLLAVLPHLARRSLAGLGIRRPTRRELAIGLVGAVAMVVVVDGVGAALEHLAPEHGTEAAIELLRKLRSPADQLLFALMAVVLAPLVEELFFRVLIFNAISRYATLGVAIVASGAIFGTVHNDWPKLDLLTIVVPLSLGGMVLAAVYVRARNYWSSVIAHACFNAASVVPVFVFHLKP